MKFFLDTADVGELREAAASGLVDGVTTNPSLIAKTGRKLDSVVREIVEIVDGPISVETISTDSAGMIKEGLEFVKIHKNIVVKAPLTREGLKATKALASEGIALGRRRITLSTSGVVPEIARAATEIGCLLAVSFHATTDEVRDRLVPINKRWNIETLLEALRAYPNLSNSERITFEYVMLDEVRGALKG